MSRRTIILIAALALVTAGLLYAAIVTTPEKQTTLAPTPTPIPKLAYTSLNLTTASASQSSTTAQHTLAVTIDTGANKVNAVQMELSYDPQALTNVTLTSGNFFTQPTTLLQNVSTESGRISYALAEQIDLSGHTGKGVVALLSFDISPTFKGTTTAIHFLPKSSVAADGILGSVLRGTTDATIHLTGATTAK